MFLIRGVSGSGKSTLAELLAQEMDGVVCETDQFFTDSAGVYRFVPSELSARHMQNQQQVERYMQADEALVIVSNTFTRRWEMDPYYKLAKEYGYEVTEMTVSGPHSAQELASRNQHSVPLATVEKQMDRFELFPDE